MKGAVKKNIAERRLRIFFLPFFVLQFFLQRSPVLGLGRYSMF